MKNIPLLLNLVVGGSIALIGGIIQLIYSIKKKKNLLDPVKLEEVKLNIKRSIIILILAPPFIIFFAWTILQ